MEHLVENVAGSKPAMEQDKELLPRHNLENEKQEKSILIIPGVPCLTLYCEDDKFR